MIRFQICSLIVLCAAVPASAQDALTDSVAEQEVWALEDAYWAYAKAGDVENYLTLWHDDFVGWFCEAPSPFRKANIGDWVEKIRDEGQELIYDLGNRTSQKFENLVVVYYTTPVEIISPNGGRLREGKVFKVTHTWMKVGEQWKIVAGMCGQLGTPERSG